MTWTQLVIGSLATVLAGPAALADSDTGVKLGRAVTQTVFSEVERAVIERYFTAPEPRSGSAPERWTVDDNPPTASAHAPPEQAATTKKSKKKSKKQSKKHESKKKSKKHSRKKKSRRSYSRAHGDALPPGIEKHRLPRDLEAGLPPPPPGTERVIIDADVVLVELTTGIVRDVIRDALEPAPTASGQ